ncbi:hypothetical protein AA313_de0202298 [Arthrobotrys entomopaga]|nr:hypothetical protein AA313_de0202298 [Arthrobotrys entomopaga]
MASVENPNIAALRPLEAEEFGDRVGALLSAAGKRYFDSHQSNEDPFPERDIVSLRASEPPTVAAITDVITNSIRNDETFPRVWTVFYKIIADLPLDKLESYRPVLDALTASPMPPKTDYWYAAWGHLSLQASNLLRFMNDHTAVWVPAIKQDSIAFRSLQERVTTSEEMRPHVRALLGWLADPNWPPYQGCWKQLARFPEATIEDIASLLESERGDGWWISHILEFVDACVPLGDSWEELKPKIAALVEEPQGDENDSEVAQQARTMLDRYDNWLQERLGRMASGS